MSDKDMAQVVFFDPGVTTGMAVIWLDADWLDGKGDASYAGLGKAVEGVWLAQCGRHARVWSADESKAFNPNHEGPQKKRGPRNRTSVLPGDDGPRPGTLVDILANHGRYGGGELQIGTADEIFQVTECQGLLDNWPDAAWGYEDFVPRQMNQSREFLSPIRVFSMLTFSEIVHGKRARTPFIQSASLAKNTATDDRLKSGGLYYPGMHHAMDAMRHAVTFLRRARSDEELKAQAWPHIWE